LDNGIEVRRLRKTESQKNPAENEGRVMKTVKGSTLKKEGNEGVDRSEIKKGKERSFL